MNATIFRRMGKYASDNAPALFTAAAVVGTVATAYLSGRAVLRADQIVRNYEQEAQHLTGDEGYKANAQKVAELTWLEYIPPFFSGICTLVCIVAANRIGTRRAAAMAAALALTERAYDEYKEKVVEKLGENRERKIKDELAQDQVTRNPVPDGQIIFLDGTASQLCYEAYTGRYFVSDMETIRKAANDINHQVNINNYCSLGDFHDAIGLDRCDVSDEMGWNLDRLLELDFSATLTAKGQPCMVMRYNVAPIRNYHRLQ